jgi:purine-binding chemotaxis protein CheW
MDSHETPNDAAEPRDGAAPAGASAARRDVRFVTWRPDAGPPPVAAPAPSSRAEAPPTPDGIVRWPPPPPAVERPPAAPARTPAATPAAAPATAPGGTSPRPPAALDEFFYRPDELAPALASADAPAGPDPVPEAKADVAAREEYLTFLLGSDEYAIAIGLVREALRCPPITEVPRAPAHVLGVVTVRGEVVAVLDPRRRLGLADPPPRPGHGRLVIVDPGEGPCGLLVDAVATVVRLRPGSVEARPQGLGAVAPECVAGVGRDHDRLFSVLDLAALLRRAPAARREGRANAG